MSAQEITTMKKILTLLLLPLIAISLNAQNARQMVRQAVFSQEIYKNWSNSDIKEINGIKIARSGSENGIDDRTNVLFIPAQGIGEDAKVAIFYDRNDATLASPENFEISVKTSDGEVLVLKQMDTAPQYYKWGIWYGYSE